MNKRKIKKDIEKLFERIPTIKINKTKLHDAPFFAITEATIQGLLFRELLKKDWCLVLYSIVDAGCEVDCPHIRTVQQSCMVSDTCRSFSWSPC